MVAAETPDAEVPPGTLVLGRYQIVGKLAQGGMAEVYLARQVGPGGYQKLVVCKRVRPHLSQDEDFVGMFVNEARLAAMINHPNVVQIFDLGEEPSANGGSDWFLAMEYLDGRDMLQVGRQCRSHNKAVPFDVTARIIADACAGLEHAHNLKGADGRPLDLVHRDMSPENIIITFEGQVKVVDFGIAKARDNSIRTQAGQIKGKLGYVAPEAILGKPVDARADVFAVGATLYLFLSGKPAFTGSTPLEIFERSLKPPQSPQEVNPRVPPLLDEICMKALAQDRDKRYRSAGEVRAALDAYLASTGRPLAAPQLSQFMRILFPPDKDQVRQRIDGLLADSASLDTLKPRAVASNAPRTVSVPHVPAVPDELLAQDQDRTAIVPPERLQAQMSGAPRAVEMPGPNAAQPSITAPTQRPSSAIRGGAAAAPSHLRSVGVAGEIPDLSNPRGRMHDPTLETSAPHLTPPSDVRDDVNTAVSFRPGTLEEPEQLHTMDVQAIEDSGVRNLLNEPTLGMVNEPTLGLPSRNNANHLNEPTLGVDISVTDEAEAALREALEVLQDRSDVIGGITMESALASSDPAVPATVQSPLQRAFSGRMPETGEARGTELEPPHFEASNPGVEPLLPSEISVSVGGDSDFAPRTVEPEPPPPAERPAAFQPILPEFTAEPALIPVESGSSGPPLWKRLGMAALGALTGLIVIVLLLLAHGDLSTVLGR